MERDPEKVRAFLDRDRPLAVTPLSCLEPDWFALCRFYLDNPPTACLWVLNFEDEIVPRQLQTFGERAALAGLLASAELPRRARLLIQREHLEAVKQHYVLSRATPYWRMHVTPETYRKPAVEPKARVLRKSDAPEIAALYALWNESRFQPSRFDLGFIYYGTYVDGRLVAIAGNQVHSKSAGVAKVIAVFVHPDWRGKGLGKGITAAITEALFEYGARDVVLDVREDNAVAIAAYESLGYSRHCSVLDFQTCIRIDG